MKMRWVFARKSSAVLFLVLAVAAVGLVRSSGWASASSTATYSQQVTQPIPPAQNYTGSAGGDGYAVALSNDRLYNVFHHSTNLIVDCHLQRTAAPCWAAGPETITDNSGHTFNTSNEANLYLDQSTGKLWVFATRASDLSAGVVCVDTTLADTNRNPFCGYTPLTNANEAQLGGSNHQSLLSGQVVVGSKLYDFNYFPGAGTSGGKNAELCFDLTTSAACAGQPYHPAFGTGTEAVLTPSPAEAAIGTEIIIPLLTSTTPTSRLTCFNTTTNSTCSGTWPIVSPTAIATYGAPYPLLTSAGAINGFCLPNGADPCFTLAGASQPTPTGMSAAIPQNYITNNPAVVLGPRIYLANHINNTVDCYDYSRSAACTNFPLALSNLGGLYTVNADPRRPTCIWVNSDNGMWQIQNFDAYNGGPCTQTRVLASQFVVPQQQCYPNSYQSLQIVSPVPSDYQGGSISFRDAAGNLIQGLSSVPLDATGTADLSGLNLNTPTGLPQFLITLTNAPVNPAPLSVRLTWTATYDPSCLTGGQTIPTATTLDANLADGANTSKTLTAWMGTPVDNNGALTGTNAATATGFVTYHWWSDSSCSTPAAPNSVQTITSPGVLPPSNNVNLPAGVYYETVNYSGDALNTPSSTSCGSEVLTVNPVPTNVTYTGDTSVYPGKSATISFVLKDSRDGSTLANMPVTLTLPDGSVYPTTTDSNGVASDTVTSPISSGDYPVSESFAGQGKYLASSSPGTLTVKPIPTTVTYTGDTSVYAGDPLTVSYVLADKWGNPLAGMPVTISLPGGGSYSTTTDAFGVASDTITAPAETSNTTLATSEAFAGQAQYLASSGPGSVLVKVIPTTITYTGDTSVYSGQTATLSFLLTDSGGNTLANKTVTITLPAGLGGGTVSGTTDANGVFSTTVTTPIVSANTTYAPSEAFAGQGRYLASSGPGSLVVHPIPTTVAYIGDTSAYSGDPLTVSYVLADKWGNPLAGMPVTISLPGGGSYSTTTDAFGVASDTITAPAETSNTTLGTSESFAGQAQYLASSGPGSVLVKVIPTTITYTGDTSVYSGQTANLSYVLKDSGGNTLANKTVTITLPAGLGGGTVSGTTDANGVFSTTVTTPIVSANTTYAPSEAFAGQGRYLASSRTGWIVVRPIPTAITYTGDTSVYSGQTANLSYVLKDSGGNTLAGEPVTISLPAGLGGGTVSGTTDASGVFSTTVTAPDVSANTTYAPSEAFAGQGRYFASSRTGWIVVRPIPTAITYTGDTSVYSGQTATISYVLKDTFGNLLPGEPVTITLPACLGGATVSGTTDANGGFSTTATAALVSTNTTCAPSEAFAGQGRYLASSRTGWIVVRPIPTAITYTGDTVAVAGQSANVSFVLRDSITNNVLPNMPVTITLPGGGTVSATTDANGVASTTTGALAVGSYSVSESFAGQAQYLASSRSGTITVITAPLDCSAKGAKCESLLADPSVVSNTQLQIVAMDDSPFTGACAPTALLLNNGKQLAVSTTATSGFTQNYVDNHGGSMSTKYEVLLKITLPSGLAAGQYSVRITACDGDGDNDQWTWTIAIDGSGNVTTVNTGPGPFTCGGAIKCESLLADPTVVSNTTLTIAAMDDSPIGTSGSKAPSAVLTNGTVLGVTTSPTSGQPPNYVDKTGGSTSTKYQTLITITLPNLPAGNYTIRVTAYDGDGDVDQWNWPIAVDGSGNVMTSASGGGTGGQLSGSTSCDGVYSGTGTTVTVPSGATCTLLPGTQVTGNVTVQKGGTLVASVVTIGGNLALQNGTATVCGSSIANDLTSSGATSPVVVGSGSCAGNTVGHDLNVTNDLGGVSVVGNTIGHDMNVNNDGPTTVVSGNTATHNASCKANVGQSGSGNSAVTGTNSCPT